MLQVSNKKFIEVQDWDNLVRETYGKLYSFQQQDGCQNRGTVDLYISKEEVEDYYPETIPYKINGNIMGVKFETWLNTNVEDIDNNHPENTPSSNRLYWHRNFYPNIEVLANDLCKKGLIEEGQYVLHIDW